MEKIKRLLLIVGILAMTSILLPKTAMADGMVYEVGDSAELGEALSKLADGDTIKLKADIVYPQAIEIYTISVTFALNSHVLNVDVSDINSTALTVANAGNVSISGEGELNVKGGENCYGVAAYYGSSAEVTSASSEGMYSTAAFAYDGTVIVSGNAQANGIGSKGAYADAGGSVTVVGNATAIGDYSYGAYVYEGSTVIIGGNAQADGTGSVGAYAYSVTTTVNHIEVGGDVISSGEASCGAKAEGEASTVEVKHTVTTSGLSSCGISAVGNASVIAHDIIATGEYSTGIWIQAEGVVTVEGDITMHGDSCTGVQITSGGTATIESNITAADTYSYVAIIDDVGTVNIEGYAVAYYFIYLDDIYTIAESTEYCVRSGNYLVYNIVDATVKIKIHPSLNIETTTLPDASAGSTYSQTISVNYIAVDNSTLVYSATGLPAGLSMNSGTGTISGTPAVNTNLTSPYSIKVSVTDGTLSASATIPLVVKAGAATPLISTQPGNTTKNCGVKATFTVAATAPDGGTLTYQWQLSPDGGTNWVDIYGATGVSYTTGNLSYDNNGYLYRCKITNTKSGTTPTSTYSGVAVLTVNIDAVNPTISSQPASITKSVGQTATFLVTATVSDGGSLTYQWQKYASGTWNNINGKTGTSYTTGTLKSNDNGSKYRCVVTNSKNGTTKPVNSSEAVLTVVTTTLSVATGSLNVATTGLSYSQSISYSYTGSATITFSATGLPSGLHINTSSGIISGTPDKGTDVHSPYSVTVNVMDGALSEAKTFFLVVIAGAEAPVIISQPINTTKYINEKATFTVAATSPDSGALTYQWQRSTNGGTSWSDLAGEEATDVSYTTDMLIASNDGNRYRCIITNTKNETTASTVSDAAVLTVTLATPSITPEVSGDADNMTDTDSLIHLEGSSARGWDEIIIEISETYSGNLTIDMSGITQIIGEALEAIRGKDLTVTFILSDGIEWIINGMNFEDSGQGDTLGQGDIPGEASLSDIDLKVTLGTDNVPAQLLEGLPSDDSLQLSLSHVGSFGFSATLRINLEGANKGKFANLYYYNSVTNQLELQSCVQISAEGNAEFKSVHASDYVILMDDGNTFSRLADQITITPAKKTLYIGGTTGKSVAIKAEYPQLLAKAIEDGSSTATITYSSSNTKVASVSTDGKVRAIKVGKTVATTTITINGYIRSFRTTITVKKAYIKLTKKISTLSKGNTYTLEAIGYGVDTKKISWTTTEESIIVIDKKTGKAIARSAGIDYVVAKVGSVMIRLKVVVTK